MLQDKAKALVFVHLLDLVRKIIDQIMPMWEVRFPLK
jgi:hypothetical protein